MRKYIDLIEQTFDLPTVDFRVDEQGLRFHDVPIMKLIEQFGTPMKLSYLPKISDNIQSAKQMFGRAMQKHNYQGNYRYCYCTKSSHFEFVLREALKNDVHLETSSAYDVAIIRKLYEQNKIDKNIEIVCNGFKRDHYLEGISELINGGFSNTIPVLDNTNELDYYEAHIRDKYNIGIRVASDEDPRFELYTSRLGVRYSEITKFYRDRIKNSSKARLKMLHIFVNQGISDSVYYWSELSRFVEKYCELKKMCPELDSLDIGGGFPVKNSLWFTYDYEYMVEQIIANVKSICDEHQVQTPNIYTEFGIYTVGESGAVIYSVLDQKLQNDKELWYMIDGSLITQLPDIWGINRKYIMLAINNWHNNFQKVNIGGLTCDSLDYYNSEAHTNEVFLPKLQDGQQQYIGFFHTGAYQEAIGGYGGIQHCLVPAPKHVVVDKNNEGKLEYKLFSDEQDSETMMRLLGY